MNAYSYPCIGAIIGDTVGSVYEFDNIKTTDFPLFSRKSNYTDDSIMTMAVASWLTTTDRSQSALETKLVDFAMRTPCPMGDTEETFVLGCFAPSVCSILKAKRIRTANVIPIILSGMDLQ